MSLNEVFASARKRWAARRPDWLQAGAERARARLDDVVGGRARRRVVVVLACVLAVGAADQGALSATADQIQQYFGISKTDLGLLGTIAIGVSAAATLPFGIFVDRVVRTRLLGWTVVAWAAAMVVSGTATSFAYLLVTRVALGMVVAVAYPAAASLIGDYFPPGERGRIYGYVLTGELMGTGLGVALAGAASSVFDTWRAAMFALAVPAVGVAWLALRLPEPARGGASRMPAGQEEILSADRVAQGFGPDHPGMDDEPRDAQDLAKQEVRDERIPPHPDLVLDRDPLRMPLPAAVRYVLRIRTNVIAIVAGALGYFFFSGLRFFAIEFVQKHYGVGRGAAFVLVFVIGIGAVAGAVVGGRVADRMLRHGRVNARIVVPSVTFIAAALLLAPGLVTTSILLAGALFFIGGFAFAASNPPLDASRLDIMPGRLWGRAESVRSVFRGGLEAAAPVTFGLVADNLFGGRGDSGLRDTFLLMLVPLVVSGLILLMAMRTYPRDVATADATEEALAAQRPRPGAFGTKSTR
jgi:MFS family permease